MKLSYAEIILLILTNIAIVLLLWIIMSRKEEKFNNNEDSPYMKMITQNIDPIMMDTKKHTSDAGKFLSIDSGMKISMEDIIKMSPNKKNDYLNDMLFADVITYHNDDLDNEHMKFENLGLGKCLKNPTCESCVEFGVTGTAMCFPKK